MKLVLAALLALGLAAGACKKQESAPAAGSKVHSSRGVIKEIKQEGKILVIDHEEFPGLMEAMVMGFELEDASKAKGLKPGDKIEFSIREAKDGAWPIVDLKKAAK